MGFNVKVVPKSFKGIRTSFNPNNPNNLPTPGSGAILGGIYHIGNGLFGGTPPTKTVSVSKPVLSGGQFRTVKI